MDIILQLNLYQAMKTILNSTVVDIKEIRFVFIAR